MAQISRESSLKFALGKLAKIASNAFSIWVTKLKKKRRKTREFELFDKSYKKKLTVSLPSGNWRECQKSSRQFLDISLIFSESFEMKSEN